MQPILYYDLGSPYAYLAAERASAALGIEPRYEPILVGGIFAQRGQGSWAHTDEREQRIAEIEARAGRYGLPAMDWPPDWPNNTLQAMRAATWADRLGAGKRFALTAFRRAFRDGADLSRVQELVAIARSLGLPADNLEEAMAGQEIKDALREATDCAWSRGVIGVPSLAVDDDVFFGDDRLEEAAERLSQDVSP